MTENALQKLLLRQLSSGSAVSVHASSVCGLVADIHYLQASIANEDFEAAIAEYKPRSLREVKLQKSDVQWSDIGGKDGHLKKRNTVLNFSGLSGLHETRRVLRETLEWPTKYSAIFAKCPLRLRSG